MYRKLLKRLMFWKETEFDWAYYISNGFWIAVVNVVVAIIGLLTTVLLSRWLTVEQFGQYRFFLSILGLLTILSATGVVNSVLRSAAKGNPYAYIQGSKFRFQLSLLGSLALIGMSVYFYLKQDVLWPVFVIAAFVFPMLYSFDALVFYLYGMQKFKQASWIKFIQIAIPSACSILTLLFTKSIVVLLVAFLVSSALTQVGAYYYYSRRLKEKKDDPDVVHYGIHLSVMNTLGVAYSYLDKLIVAYLLGYLSLAVYSVAEQIYSQYKLHTKVVLALVLPKFNKETEMHFSKVYPMLALAFGLSIAAYAVLYFIIPYAIIIAFTEKYSGAISLARWLLFAAIFWMPSLILSAFLESRKMIVEMYLYQLAMPILGISLYVALAYAYGISGIVYSIAITQVVSIIVLFLLARGILRPYYQNLERIKAYAKKLKP